MTSADSAIIFVLLVAMANIAATQPGSPRIVGTQVFGDASGPLGDLSMPSGTEMMATSINLTNWRSDKPLTPELAALTGPPPLPAQVKDAANIVKDSLKLAGGIIGTVSKGVGVIATTISVFTNSYKVVADPYNAALKTEDFAFTLYDNQRKLNNKLYDEWSKNIKLLPDVLAKYDSMSGVLDSINEALDNGYLLKQVGLYYDQLQVTRRLVEINAERYGNKAGN